MEECRGMFLFFVKIELDVGEGGMLVSTLGLCARCLQYALLVVFEAGEFFFVCYEFYFLFVAQGNLAFI
jgi:hypothetical protein